ncbi:MAG TPA: hypothetical protein ENH28_05650 [Euryarchaeota archaeon]|nr:hypothetical protein BMS3Bbin15_00373 [archaeon BMS3Bbin15]HDL15616.1 hypothetical protein [Euryarchaeota archaeon]
MEEYENQLGLEEDLKNISLKVAFDVLIRAGFHVKKFNEGIKDAASVEGLREYFEYVRENPDYTNPEIIARKDGRTFIICIEINNSEVLGLRKRLLSKAKDYNLIPMIFRTAINLNIPSSSLEFLQESQND